MNKIFASSIKSVELKTPKLLQSKGLRFMLGDKEILQEAKERLNKAKTRRKINHLSIILINVLIIVFLAIFIIANQFNKSVSSSFSSPGSLIGNPLDQLASANIALTVAQVSNLPETTAISNQAESQNAQVSMDEVSNNIISKNQVIETSLKSNKNITTYRVQPGDTLASLAIKFGVNSQSIAGSNGLTIFSSLTPGQTLNIPPMNGLVYIVKSGDTIASIASKFNISQSNLIAYNDAQLKGIYVGEKLLIPNGSLPSATQLNYGWGGPSYGFNGYDWGYCTWYVATQIAVPDNWGNAGTWAYYAQLSGWKVSQTTPTVGAIAQDDWVPGYYGNQGHVAIVTAVSGNMIKYKDMNGLRGFDQVGYSGWVPASTFQNYITH